MNLSCPRSLIKTTISFGQYGHFNQVGAFNKSYFLVVKAKQIPKLIGQGKCKKILLFKFFGQNLENWKKPWMDKNQCE